MMFPKKEDIKKSEAIFQQMQLIENQKQIIKELRQRLDITNQNTTCHHDFFIKFRNIRKN